jgi:hypothetical protein
LFLLLDPLHHPFLLSFASGSIPHVVVRVRLSPLLSQYLCQSRSQYPWVHPPVQIIVWVTFLVFFRVFSFSLRI